MYIISTTTMKTGTYGSHASTSTYKKYPYWKLDTEKSFWKSNISCEDKVPVLFKNGVVQSKPRLCCPWQTPRLCTSSSWARPPSPRAGEALPQWRVLAARGQHRPRHGHGPGNGNGNGPGPAALQGDPKSPALGRLMALANVAGSERQSALAPCTVL